MVWLFVNQPRTGCALPWGRPAPWHCQQPWLWTGLAPLCASAFFLFSFFSTNNRGVGLSLQEPDLKRGWNCLGFPLVIPSELDWSSPGCSPASELSPFLQLRDIPLQHIPLLALFKVTLAVTVILYSYIFNLLYIFIFIDQYSICYIYTYIYTYTYIHMYTQPWK